MTADRLTPTDGFDDRWVPEQNVSQLTSAFDGLPTGVIDDIMSNLTPELRGSRHHHSFGDDQALSQLKIFSHLALVHD